jgi:predicted kinase
MDYNLSVKSSPSSRLVNDVQRLLESLGILPQPVKQPVFIALSGLPGTGKSYFSRQLALHFPVAILESDALRKVLFPQPTYESWESARLFRAIYFLIEELLKNGISVILDATNLVEQHRRRLYSIARRTNARFALIQIKAPVKVIRDRLEERARISAGYSDADWNVYQTMKTKAEKIKRRHYSVDTSRDIAPVIEKIINEVVYKRSVNGN